MFHGHSRHAALLTSAALAISLATVTTAQATCGANAILGTNSCDGTTSLTGSFLDALLSVTTPNSGEDVAVVGGWSTSAAGGSATALRGINDGTNANGSGVYGSHAGSGRGVRGTSVLGDGMFGSHLATTGTDPG